MYLSASWRLVSVGRTADARSLITHDAKAPWHPLFSWPSMEGTAGEGDRGRARRTGSEAKEVASMHAEGRKHKLPGRKEP